jgi:hypothetical protein
MTDTMTSQNIVLSFWDTLYSKLVYCHRTCHDGRSSSRRCLSLKTVWFCCWCALRLTTDRVIKENVSDRPIITAGAPHWISFQLKRSHFQLTYVACCSLLRHLCTTGSEVLCRDFSGFICSSVFSGRSWKWQSLCKVNGRHFRVMPVFLSTYLYS